MSAFSAVTMPFHTGQKSVLITGCSAGGIGSALAIAFAKRGYHVFATVRDHSKADQIATIPNVEVLTVDVTSPNTITSAFNIVEERLDGRGLDILINNAARSYTTPLLDANLAEGKAVFDTNFWGVLAVSQAFAPLLIRARGTIVNLGSVGGLLYLPWIGTSFPESPFCSRPYLLLIIHIYAGLYGASKAAVNIISETLRLELAPLGVSVLTAMTGFVATNFFPNTTYQMLPPDSHYKKIESFVTDATAKVESPKPMDADLFAEQLVQDIVAGKKGILWPGPTATMSKWIGWYLPSFITVCSSLYSRQANSYSVFRTEE